RSCSARPAAPRLVAYRRAVHTPTSSCAVAASAPPPGYPVPCSSPGPVDDPDPHLLGAPCSPAVCTPHSDFRGARPYLCRRSLAAAPPPLPSLAPLLPLPRSVTGRR